VVVDWILWRLLLLREMAANGCLVNAEECECECNDNAQQRLAGLSNPKTTKAASNTAVEIEPSAVRRYNIAKRKTNESSKYSVDS
jgi:hypothetical protein